MSETKEPKLCRYCGRGPNWNFEKDSECQTVDGRHFLMHDVGCPDHPVVVALIDGLESLRLSLDNLAATIYNKGIGGL